MGCRFPRRSVRTTAILNRLRSGNDRSQVSATYLRDCERIDGSIFATRRSEIKCTAEVGSVKRLSNLN